MSAVALKPGTSAAAEVPAASSTTNAVQLRPGQANSARPDNATAAANHVVGIGPHKLRVEHPLGEQPAHLLAELILARQPQSGEQPQPDRLAVAVARVSRRGLDRVADRVA